SGTDRTGRHDGSVSSRSGCRAWASPVTAGSRCLCKTVVDSSRTRGSPDPEPIAFPDGPDLSETAAAPVACLLQDGRRGPPLSPCPVTGSCKTSPVEPDSEARIAWSVLQRITVAAWPAAAFSTGQPDATGAGHAPFNSSVYPRQPVALWGRPSCDGKDKAS